MTTTIAPSAVRWFTDVRMRILVEEPAVGIVEGEARAGNMPPLHVHHDADECFYVVEGRLSVFLPGRRLELEAGDAAFAPRAVPHAYRVESETARWIAVCTPGGFAAFIREASVPAEGDGYAPEELMPPPEELGALAAKQRIDILGPPGLLP